MKKITFTVLAIVLFGCAEKEKTTQAVPDPVEKKWWKEGILYQLYPQSFKDTDGDGFGDFKGIIEKLDYLESLGITMVWMNPFFDSPLVDNGYDMRDYRTIHERYGTMEDFDAMLAGMHERGIKFVLDVVVNHSSNEHDWFKQSRSSRDSPYREYYHWWPSEKGDSPFKLQQLKGLTRENVLINNYGTAVIEEASILLRPYQAVLFSL